MNRRPLVGIAAAAVMAASPLALSAARAEAPAARSASDPVAQSVILDGHLKTPTRLVISYVIAGNTSVFSDPQTGDPILADGGELGSVSIFIDGRARGGSDAGDVTCAAHAKVREYYDQFPARRFHVHAADSHRVRVVTHFCSPDGTMSKTTERMVVR